MSRRHNPSPASTEMSVTPCELLRVTLPLAIARGLFATAARDDGRKALYHTVCVDEEAGRTVLVSTDTCTLMVAAPPNPVAIPTGNYFQQVPPFRENGAGVMLLRKIEDAFPHWRKVVPDPNDLAQIGTFNNKPSGMFGTPAGRLELSGTLTIAYGRLAALAPENYTIARKVVASGGSLYSFDGCLDGWTLRYIVMGMVESGWEMGANKP